MPTIQLGEDDYVAAGTLHNSASLKRILIVGIAFAAFGLLIIFNLLSVIPVVGWDHILNLAGWGDAFPLLVGLGFSAAYALLRYILFPRRLRRIYRQQKDLQRLMISYE